MLEFQLEATPGHRIDPRREGRAQEIGQKKNKVMACFVMRAKVILALDEGKSISETARLIDMERRHIYKWVSRYKARGQSGLNDLHRTGRLKSNRMAAVEIGNS